MKKQQQSCEQSFPFSPLRLFSAIGDHLEAEYRALCRIYGIRPMCAHTFGTWSLPRPQVMFEDNVCNGTTEIVGRVNVFTRICSRCSHVEYRTENDTTFVRKVPWYDKLREANIRALR